MQTEIVAPPTSPQMTYVARNPRSLAHGERAEDSLPGGITRSTIYFAPYPACMVSGQGCRAYDLDGNERIDFLNNYSSLILGHAHPAVVQAVIEQVSRGSAFGAPNERELELAERLRARMPSLERVHFTNSGTEATMFALRLARAFTGRTKVGKIVGGYHGTHDYVLPAGSLGVPHEVSQLMVDLPFNDEERTEQIVRQHKDELAAIIVEPILGAGGVIPARSSFLHLLRNITDMYGVILIFDEIIAFRVSYGGAQEVYGVRPDLTTLGKIVGGGYPLAAFGGRKDIMELLDQRRSKPSIAHGGTFNGHPVAATAGITTLDLLTPEAIASLNTLGDLACAKLRRVFERAQVPAQVTGSGSLFNLHWTAQPIVDYASAKTGDNDVLQQLVLQLMNEGVWLAPRGMGCISAPMTEVEIDALADATERAIEVLYRAGSIDQV